MSANHNRTCRECGDLFLALKSHAAFCSTKCRKTWNNRRATRGAQLYDAVMAMRYDRKAAAAAGIDWTFVSRMVEMFNAEDQRDYRPARHAGAGRLHHGSEAMTDTKHTPGPWGVRYHGELDPRTVSATEVGAMKRSLQAHQGRYIDPLATDEEIREMFSTMRLIQPVALVLVAASAVVAAAAAVESEHRLEPGPRAMLALGDYIMGVK
jgi:hypothetical protein